MKLPTRLALLLISATFTGLSGCQALQDSPGANPMSLLGLNGEDRDSIASDELMDPLGARDANRLLLDDLAPDQFLTTVKARTSRGTNQEAAREHYEAGQRLYQEGTGMLESNADAGEHQEVFSQAANEFRLAAASWEDSSVEEDALYFEGESYFFADRYVQANRAFEKLIAQYPGTRFLDMAENRRFAIAIYWLQLSQETSPVAFADLKRPKFSPAKEARRVLHRIRIDDPTGDLADDATLTLAKAFMHAERYYEAADTLEDLRKNYPGSKHQFDAHMLEMEARLASYQGTNYDATPLLKADEILKSVVTQFPAQSRENIKYLEQQSKAIQSSLAERDYAVAQYYEGRGEHEAALRYLAKVSDRYQGTDVAQQVEQRMADLKTKPPRPEQHLSWLVDLFPDPEQAKPVILASGTQPIRQ